jgi:hypothetical protein
VGRGKGVDDTAYCKISNKGREAVFSLSGKMQNLSIDYKTGKAILTLEINEKRGATSCFEEFIKEEKIVVKIGKYRAKRSLDANAYCWKLIGELAERLNLTTTEIYRAAIRELGGNREIVCVKEEAVEKLCEAWTGKGIGWQTDTFDSKIKGCRNVILYYGSSTYDTQQMSQLISYIVDECQAQGIDTRTPAEIAELVSLWGEK